MNMTLHWGMCASLEKEEISDVKEYPRGHLKTSACCIGGSMWWALPFTEDDERLMRGLRYGDEFIRWMRRAHDQNTSTLIISETDENAELMGVEIGLHYKQNEVFRHIFKSILPDSSCTWNLSRMRHKRINCSDKEGTYELAGVGKALQSRHYPRIIEDDLFGEKALFSPSEAEFTIEFHRKLPGLFRAESARPHHIGDNLVIGNRWGIHDLNGWIRKNQPSYKFETHSVDGGCCDAHPKGKFIFPEFFNSEKLAKLRESLGPTALAAQYYNNPIDDSVRKFKHEWLRHYSLVHSPHPNGIIEDDGKPKMISAIRHEVAPGEEHVPKDIYLSQLNRFIVIDVIHNENKNSKGKSRNVVLVIGHLPGKTPRFYILSLWCKRSLYSEMADIAFKKAKVWRASTIWMETEAGQAGWLYYFRERNANVKSSGSQVPLKIEELRRDRSEDAKHRRICALEPLFFSNQIWASRADEGYEEFKSEYDSYPSDQTIDALDTMGRMPECVIAGGQTREDQIEAMRRREHDMTGKMMGNTTYFG